MPTWPDTLPSYFEFDEYEETPPDVILRTQMSDAVPIVRRRGRDGVALLNGYMVMTPAQARTLDSFFRDDCSYGTLSFLWPDCAFRVGGGTLVQYNSIDEVQNIDLLTDFDQLIGYTGSADSVCRFVEPPKYSAPGGLLVAASLTLEILP